jgi:4-hydroxybenzoate polyprenyltransferase
MKNYLCLMRLDKPIGIYLLLWPTLWALWLASRGSPSFFIFFIFLSGVILMRSAGCVINDILDRHIDGNVLRTKERPLVSKKISLKAALFVLFVLLFVALMLLLSLNALTIQLGFFGALFVFIYPYLKRITHLPQVGLGVAFSWGIPMAFAAILNAVPFEAWFLFVSAMLWPIIYDTQYAMTDRADDIKVGVKSTAILFGRFDIAIIAFLQVIFFLLLFLNGVLFQLKYSYFLCVGVAGLFFIYQQYLIKDRLRENCFKAFLNHQYVGGIIFLGIFLSYVQ